VHGILLLIPVIRSLASTITRSNLVTVLIFQLSLPTMYGPSAD